MCLAYLVYYYKLNKIIHAAQVSLQYDRELVKIAIAMGATIGLAFFLVNVTVMADSDFSDITFITSILLFI